MVRILTTGSLSNARKVKMIFHHLIDIHVEHGHDADDVQDSSFKQLELFDD